ncbi:MAG TPA: type II toxin-antitoxin system VapC family toxin [Methanobacterium sp.]
MDANVIVHALIEEDKDLNPQTVEIKRNSRNIVKRISSGEDVYITTIQVSETLNILERLTEPSISIRILRFLLEHPSFNIVETTIQDMRDAHRIVEMYKNNRVGFNDAIAYITMQKIHCEEIYTFDKHFDIFPGIIRIEE